MMMQQSELQKVIAQMMTATSTVASRTAGDGRDKGKPWRDLDLCRNVNPFSGDARDWEELNGKLKGQLSAHSLLVGDVIDHVESMLSETELDGDLEIELADQTEVNQEQAKEITSKVYNVLLDLTTGGPTRWSGGGGGGTDCWLVEDFARNSIPGPLRPG